MKTLPQKLAELPDLPTSAIKVIIEHVDINEQKVNQIKAVLENSSEQTDTHLLNVIKHIVYEIYN